MRPKSKLFEGSDSLCETQHFLVKNNIAGHTVWWTHFSSERLDHLGFVNHLLNTFCALDISCALVGTFPAYIAGLLISHYVDTLRVSQQCIARTDSPILDNIYRKFSNLVLGPFKFHITAEEEYAKKNDYSVYKNYA